MVRCSCAGTKPLHTRHTFYASLIALCLIATGSGRADEWDALSRSPSMLIVETRVAAGGARDIYTGLDLNAGNERRLILYLSRSEGLDQTTTASNAYGLGLTSATDQPVAVSLGIDALKQDHAVEIDSYHLTIDLTPNDWRLSITAELRRIRLVTSPTLRRLRPQLEAITTDSRSTTIALGYAGWQAWTLNLYYRQDHYDDNPERLAQRPRLSRLIFTQAALNSAWNLTRRQQGISLRRYFDYSYVTTSYDTSRSAVDNSAFYYLALRLGHELDYQWIMEIEMGRGTASTAQGVSNSYGAVAIIRSW